MANRQLSRKGHDHGTGFTLLGVVGRGCIVGIGLRIVMAIEYMMKRNILLRIQRRLVNACDLFLLAPV